MDSRIEQLLDKYWKCETTLEEENELRVYFNTETAPDELKETSLLFKYFEEQKKQKVNEVVFDKKIRSSTGAAGKGRMIKMIFTSAKIAAGIVVLLAASYLVRQEIRKSYPEEIADTYTDPQLAFEETKKALMMISKTFGKAKEETSKIKVFSEAEEMIQRGAGKESSSEQVDI